MADSSSYTSITGGSSAPTDQLAYQGVQDWQNSANQYQRSLSNVIGQSGQQTQQAGQQLTQEGTAELQPALNYWQGILSGNKADVAAAVQPEITASNNQFESNRKVLDQYTPMGGGRSASLARNQTAKAQTNANIVSTARANAAPALAGTATAEQSAGLQQQSLGIQQLGQAIQSILQKMGIDQSGSFANQFNSIMSGIGAII
jgi:DNA-binding transcriptional MocR family regulator